MAEVYKALLRKVEYGTAERQLGQVMEWYGKGKGGIRSGAVQLLGVYVEALPRAILAHSSSVFAAILHALSPDLPLPAPLHLQVPILLVKRYLEIQIQIRIRIRIRILIQILIQIQVLILILIPIPIPILILIPYIYL